LRRTRGRLDQVEVEPPRMTPYAKRSSHPDPVRPPGARVLVAATPAVRSRLAPISAAARMELDRRRAALAGCVQHGHVAGWVRGVGDAAAGCPCECRQRAIEDPRISASSALLRTAWILGKGQRTHDIRHDVRVCRHESRQSRSSGPRGKPTIDRVPALAFRRRQLSRRRRRSRYCDHTARQEGLQAGLRFNGYGLRAQSEQSFDSLKSLLGGPVSLALARATAQSLAARHAPGPVITSFSRSAAWSDELHSGMSSVTAGMWVGTSTHSDADTVRIAGPASKQSKCTTTIGGVRSRLEATSVLAENRQQWIP